MIAGYSQVTAIVVTGPDGHPLAASSRFPADRGISFGDREYFAALRDRGEPFHIGGIVMGRLTQADVFTVAIRRGNDPTRFAGAILVGVSPSYFNKFDSDMFGGDPDYIAHAWCARTARRSPQYPTSAEPRHDARPAVGRCHRAGASGGSGARRLVGRWG